MIRAFLVDDEDLALRRLSRLLAESGRVAIAGTSNDPVDAIAWLSSNEVDVVFLDIEMPGMNGFENAGDAGSTAQRDLHDCL